MEGEGGHFPMRDPHGRKICVLLWRECFLCNFFWGKNLCVLERAKIRVPFGISEPSVRGGKREWVFFHGGAPLELCGCIEQHHFSLAGMHLFVG